MKKILQHTFKYLAIYLSASLDIESAIGLVCRRMKHKKMLALFLAVRDSIGEGKSARDAFAILRERNLIDSVSWAIFVSAERGGNIKDAFFSISANMEERSKNQLSLAGALAYPVGMFCASLCMVIFLVTVAFPKIIPLFKSMNAPVPKTTQYMLNVSNFTTEWGVYLALAFGLSTACLTYVYKRNADVRSRLQQWVLRIPLLSKIILYREYSSVASSMEVLLKNNITVSESLKIAEESASLIPVASQIRSVYGSVQAGQRLSQSLERESYFSDEWVDLATVGEMTGKLSDSFRDISVLYQSRYRDMVQVLVRISEPLALVFTAVVVLVIALSVVTPMYAIIQQVQGQ